MSNSELISKLIAVKANHIKNLIKMYEAEYQKLGQQQGGADNFVTNERIKSLEKEIQEFQREIEELKAEGSNTDVNRLFRDTRRNWEEKLHEIDFCSINRLLERLSNNFKHREGFALFLIPKTGSMGGEWCIYKIEDKLKGLGQWDPPCKFRFQSREQANASAFLSYLIKRYQVDLPSEVMPMDRIIAAAIDKICESLRAGSILFLTIEIYRLDADNQFLKWFVDDFWCKLLQKVTPLKSDRPLIRVVAVLSVRGTVPSACLPGNLATKILKLTLQKWKKAEIKNWLLSFSGLLKPPFDITPQDIDCMAESIYEVTEGGVPQNVYRELLRELNNILEEISTRYVS